MSTSPKAAEPAAQNDLFVANVTEWPVKDDLASMEFPIFALTKNRDTNIREYVNPQSGKSIRVTPAVIGGATVFDKDILLYIGSQIMEARRNGDPISRNVKVDVYNFLTSTCKSTGGNAYTLILDMLRRLKGTSIETNIKTGDVEQTRGFGLIEDYTVDRYTKNKKGVLEATVTMSEWLFNALIHFEVLTIDRRYFLLGGALERRLYELARKHTGDKAIWKCDIEIMRQKTGSSQSLRGFRSEVRTIIKADSLPNYRVALDTSCKPHKVVFYTRDTNVLLEELRKAGNLGKADNLEWFEKLERCADSAA